ncbi:MAG TPA: DEAD/DEAH box helicase [Kofleriaceae bacterium]|nr:DEAD/DEAH box helicase [Kofleriaceae bacterium]
MSDSLAQFGAAARTWFAQSFAQPTAVQERGWASIAAGHHTLMLAPTGSGKTLAAFLWCLDRLTRLPPDAAEGTRVVYVSPIKALAYDIERNLRAPLAGLQRLGAGAQIAVDVRTGDTSQKDRERQRKQPGQILITTPESLYLVLASRARERLRSVETIIVDEIHALAPSKRGVHLALTLERLCHLVTSAGGAEPQRIGLSATQRPLVEVARYLGGDRPVEIVDASAPPAMDLAIVVPAQEMDHPGTAGRDGGGMWPLIYPRLLEMILAHRTTIIFVNSRRLAERVSQQLTELAVATGVAPGAGAGGNGESAELVRAHHGSVARHQRLEIEEALKAGRLRAIAATSSLELGIDMGTVDLVIQVESPGAVSRGLQRIGRAGHHVGGVSIGRIVPKFRGDLLEATVVAQRMLAGEVESVRVPDSALDVLAQQIVAMVAVDAWRVDELEQLIRRTASYRELSRAALTGVLDMLAGRYPSDEFAELRPRLTWDRQTDVLVGRKGARLLSVVSGGTIPDRGTYAVHAGEGGPRVGELDEEMVAESRKGETFLLGATTWRIEDITRDRVIVSPAPGEPGKMPFWRGEGPGRPIELGRALGEFCRTLDDQLAHDPAGAHAWLTEACKLDRFAADNLIAYLGDQRAQTGGLPTDRAITIERFRDELGDVRVCILSPFGSRVHAPWSLVIARQLEAELGYPIHPLYTDDGIALRFADGDLLPTDDQLVPDPDDVENVLVEELSRSSVFASHFRENAARALLLPRRRPGQRTPLWVQRLRAQQLMGVALRFPAFPITLETYREVLRDVFDLPALLDVLRQIRSRAIRIEPAATEVASPFARSLVFDYVAAFLYEGDAPLAERKAQALTLDRNLLRELIGGGELRELLDPDVLAEVEAELQQLTDERKARSVDEVHDLLRRVGDLSLDEIAARTVTPLEGLPPRGGAPADGPGARADGPGARADIVEAVEALVVSRRAARVRIAGAPRVIAAEDAARYRDGLGVQLPAGLPAALLEPVAGTVGGAGGRAGSEQEAFLSLVARWARTHAPFTAAEPAARWGLPAAQIEPVLALLEARNQLVRGELRPGGSHKDSCDPEVLRQLRRRTLAKLRAQVAPVGAAAFAAFLPRWHGLDQPRRGVGALRDAIGRLEGVALPFSELEARILPARILDYHPRMLDELGAAGELVWVGAGALGTKDGRVILLRRDRALALAPDPQPLAHGTAVHDAILAHLAQVGASFLVAIEQAVAGAIPRPARPERFEPRDPSARSSGHASVIAALWDLVWAGVVTNDTFAPLRSLGQPAGRRFSAHAAFGGRWSLVTSLGPAPTTTMRALAQATALLERWGIAGRATARADDLPGGFSAIGDVLRAMEDAGTVRRGYFVESLPGAQFAWPGAIDRLREAPRGDAQRVDVLPAVDPACAWGSALPWPPLSDPGARPARRVGATAILVDGELAVWLEPKARRIVTGPLPAESIELALAVGLPRIAARARRRELLIELIDGVAAGESPLARVLLANSARADYRGLVVRAQPSAIPPPSPTSIGTPITPSITARPTSAATAAAPPPTPLAPAPKLAPKLAAEPEPGNEAELDGLDFDAEPEGPEADADLADTGAEPDAEGDFDADA